MSKFGSVRITDEDGNEIVQVIGGALRVTGSLGSGSIDSEELGDDGSDLLTEVKKIRRALELILNEEIRVEDI